MEAGRGGVNFDAVRDGGRDDEAITARQADEMPVYAVHEAAFGDVINLIEIVIMILLRQRQVLGRADGARNGFVRVGAHG